MWTLQKFIEITVWFNSCNCLRRNEPTELPTEIPNDLLITSGHQDSVRKMKSEINVDDDQSGGPIPLGIGSSEAEPAGVYHQSPLSQYGKVHGGSALGESFHILNSSGHGQVNCGHVSRGVLRDFRKWKPFTIALYNPEKEVIEKERHHSWFRTSLLKPHW